MASSRPRDIPLAVGQLPKSLLLSFPGESVLKEHIKKASLLDQRPPHHSKIEEPCLSPGQDEGEQDQHHIICDWLAVPLVLEHL